jgi:hypothetical protein
MFEFHNSTIYDNIALSGAVAELFSSQIESIVENSTITRNLGVTKDQINNDIITQGKLNLTISRIYF